jgi:hypothetical protein
MNRKIQEAKLKGFKTNFAEQDFQTITFLQPDVASLNAEDAIN